MVVAIFPLLKEPKTPTDMSAVGIFLCMMNWSMIEVVRFGFYFSKAQSPDSFLSRVFGHLRYNIFLFAYILGVAGENFTIYYAYEELAKIDDSGLLPPWTVRMPNAFNFAFDFRGFIKISPLMYLGGFPGLYMHMLAQRKKFYGGGASAVPAADI